MRIDEVIKRRLTTQGLTGPGFRTPEAAVERLTAVQSQEFAAAKWALGERCRGTVDTDIQAAFDQGRILRTHILRPTWHFVLPADIRWMLRLTSPHVKRMNATYLRKQGLDAPLVSHCHRLMTGILENRNFQTRADMRSHLASAGIDLSGFQLGFVVMEAELDGLICSGPMRGKQHTYALLDERVRNERVLVGEDALGELARRYVVGHGPSTDREFARWSDLTLTQVRHGLNLVAAELESIDIEGQTHWFDPDATFTDESDNRAFLLHEYDECYLTYSHVNFPNRPLLSGNELFPSVFYRPVIINGWRVGLWRRTVARKAIGIELLLFGPLDANERDLLDAEIRRFGDFHAMPAAISSISHLTQ